MSEAMRVEWYLQLLVKNCGERLDLLGSALVRLVERLQIPISGTPGVLEEDGRKKLCLHLACDGGVHEISVPIVPITA